MEHLPCGREDNDGDPVNWAKETTLARGAGLGNGRRRHGRSWALGRRECGREEAGWPGRAAVAAAAGEHGPRVWTGGGGEGRRGKRGDG